MPKTIAVFTKNRLNPAYAAARLGADRVAKRFGVRTVHYVPEKPDDAGEQIALIDAALRERPDAAMLVPVHPTAVNASIRNIVASGVPLIGFLNRFTEKGLVSYVGCDDYALASRIAEYLAERLAGRGRIVIMEGASHSVTSAERVRGFRDTLERFPNVSIVATICGDYLRAPAKRAAEQLLASQVEFDAVIAANDDMALGMIEALERAGRAMPIVGVNAIPEAIAAIGAGKLLATADFNAMSMSAIATEAAIRHMNGERVPAEIILPAQVVDRANCSQWDSAFEQRALPRWEDAVR